VAQASRLCSHPERNEGSPVANGPSTVAARLSLRLAGDPRLAIPVSEKKSLSLEGEGQGEGDQNVGCVLRTTKEKAGLPARHPYNPLSLEGGG
jgi:hypothetical protein